MLFLDNPAEMTPEQRRAEIAAILSQGYLRSRPLTENPDKPVDVVRDPTPPCDNGLTHRDLEDAGV